MKKMSIISLAIITLIVSAQSCNTSAPEKKITAEIPNDSLIRRGAYLVVIMGCNDCHTPKKMTDKGVVPDMEKMLSGHPASLPVAGFDTTTSKNWILFSYTNTATVGPWGTSFAANLTSDETGIGTWTEAQFRKALTEGKFKGLDNTRPLLPPMPWENFKDIRDEDISAIYAFLKSTPAIKNLVPAAIPPAIAKK